MKSAVPLQRDAAVKILAQRSESAWKLLHEKYANRMAVEELDHLFARFVFGLTLPLFESSEPSAQYEVCRELISQRLSAERTYAALHLVPVTGERWIELAFDKAEEQGVRIGRALSVSAADFAGCASTNTNTAAAAGEEVKGELV